MLFDDPNLLSNDEIREQLTQDGYSPELVDEIIQQFWIHDWGNSFISIKEHFHLLQEFLIEVKPATFSRFDFYTFFFSNTVPHYDSLSQSLQKIAVVFELMQTDHIDIGDFEELLNDLKITEEISLQFFVDAKLITISEKEERKIAKWVHHTLTEYLSTVYILDQKEIIKTVDRFVCSTETGVVTFIPSWVGTLRFLVEKSSEVFIDWLETNLKANPDFLNDQLAEVIVFATPTSIPEGYKTKLFHLVYDSYQEKKWWIPVWAYHNLYKFIDAGIYKILKDNANDQRYEYRGNTAATVDGMLQNNHPLLTTDEKNFWKEKLIGYATEENTNGVLQRHSLAALENFTGDSSIIEAVAVNDKSTDTLVREAFINMCKTVDPNSAASIGFFIKGIAEDTSHIYARTALYSVSSPDGIKTLLNGIADNQQFIHEFLDKESIFNKKEKQADGIIVENIRKNLDEENTTLIKKLIINAFIGEKNYRAGDSYFLRQLALLVKSQEPKYLEEIISTIQNLTLEGKNHLFINDFEGVLSVLLEVDELEGLKGVFNDTLHHHSGYTFAEAIRLAPRNGNPDGAAVLQKGIELGITADPNALPKYVDYQKEQELKIYKQFQEYLSPPTEGQYFPQVFNWYIENQKIIDAYCSTAEKERLLELAVKSNLEKIDPVNFEVRYKNQETKSGEYTITSLASYFADVLQVVYKLNPSLLKTTENRKKVINYIPFTYLSDFKNLREILEEITDTEIESLNEAMLDKTKDVRYLVPQTYIYIAKTYPGLQTPKNVLMSFIEDPKISASDREYALDNLEKYLSPSDTTTEKLLKKLWEPGTRSRISDLANGLLITVFHNEEAIDWRFGILKSYAKPFRKQEGFHSVGELEYELDYLKFANPIIELRDEKYMEKIIGLLDFSLTIIEKEGYWEYVNYLWKVAISYVTREDFLLSATALQALREWAEKNKAISNINWFNKRLEQTATNTSQDLGKIKNLKEAIEQL